MARTASAGSSKKRTVKSRKVKSAGNASAYTGRIADFRKIARARPTPRMRANSALVQSNLLTLVNKLNASMLPSVSKSYKKPRSSPKRATPGPSSLLTKIDAKEKVKTNKAPRVEFKPTVPKKKSNKPVLSQTRSGSSANSNSSNSNSSNSNSDSSGPRRRRRTVPVSRSSSSSNSNSNKNAECKYQCRRMIQYTTNGPARTTIGKACRNCGKVKYHLYPNVKRTNINYGPNASPPSRTPTPPRKSKAPRSPKQGGKKYYARK